MKIVADENIAYADRAFSTLGDVMLLNGREITNEVLRDADVLLTRSITKVDASLLKKTSVRFVGTATIGTDHIDTEFLRNENIAFADAKGCNADAVAEYIFAAVYLTAAADKIVLKDASIAIIGGGNIGSRVARIASAAGMRVLLNDPPLKRTTGDNKYLELDEVIDADIVTIHVPLLTEGEDRTYHLFDEHNLMRLSKKGLFINASRGEVVNNNDLLKAAVKRPFKKLILDVWENEPFINHKLLKRTKAATPHIAGYSLEGKVNGTVLIYHALCRHLGINPVWQPEMPPVENAEISINSSGSEEEIIGSAIRQVYDIQKDDQKLKEILHMRSENAGRYFDKLRKEYPLRREFFNYNVNTGGMSPSLTNILTALRFNIS